jgi:hypothetical protein
MTMKRIAGVLILAMLAGGCAKRVPVPVVTARAVTLDVHQAIAGIAAVNKAIAQEAINLNRPGLVTDEFAGALLGYNKLVARAVLASEEILRGGAPAGEAMESVRTLFAELRLPASVDALIRGEQSGRPMVSDTIAGLKSAVISMQSMIAALVGK